jgi:hypothetical protein
MWCWTKTASVPFRKFPTAASVGRFEMRDNIQHGCGAYCGEVQRSKSSPFER